MKDKIIKERITTDNIITDSKAKFKASIRTAILAVGLLFILSLSILVPFFVYSSKERLFLLPFILLALLLVYIVIAGYIMAFKEYITVRRKKFTIVKDRLVDKKAEIVSRYHPRPNTLIFKNYGSFFLSEYWHYSYSAQYTMFDAELFRTSNIDDEFYLVVNKKNKVLLVYNAKYFEIVK